MAKDATNPLSFSSSSSTVLPSISAPKMMHMTFYWGIKATILFDSWRTDSWTSYLLSLVALFAVAAFYQYMEDRRLRFKLLATRSKAFPISAPLLEPAPLSVAVPVARAATAVLFGVNSAIGYLLMLAVMSFNAGVFLAVVVGLAAGYFLFRSGGEEDIVVVENACACA